MNDATRYHSVILDESACKGCTVCVTACPSLAIRVRDGKARILAERCIDCGECIRRCPNHAKKALANVLAEEIGSLEGKYDFAVALPAPSLYGQFPEWPIADIHASLLGLGFDEVYPVSSATGDIARATASFLDKKKHPGLPRPLISSSCPAVIKLIQIRFPTLLEHIVPVIAPMELAARRAREKAEKEHPGVKPERIGIFFISPCAGKITEAKTPLGNETSAITGVFSMKDLHLPLLVALKKNRRRAGEMERLHATGVLSPGESASEIAWARAGGEADATVGKNGYASLSVDGMDQCTKILESVEDGKLEGFDFLELMACTNGCVGGPLSVANPALARHAIQKRETATGAYPAAPAKSADSAPADSDDPIVDECLRTGSYPPRPAALLLDPDYKKAMQMMERMEAIYEDLPGLDCGCCGAPGCHALAEDIVRGMASREDCVIILKEQYRQLLEGDQ